MDLHINISSWSELEELKFHRTVKNRVVYCLVKENSLIFSVGLIFSEYSLLEALMGSYGRFSNVSLVLLASVTPSFFWWI